MTIDPLLRPARSPQQELEFALVILAGTILTTLIVWYAISITLLALAHGTNSHRLRATVARWGAPFIKGLAATGLAATLATPAFAAATEPDAIDLSWGAGISLPETSPISAPQLLPSPDLDTTPSPPASLTPSPTPAAPPVPAQPAPASISSVSRTEPGDVIIGGRIHVVAHGDSLWRIARTHYPSSSDAELATIVQGIYRANAAVIGPDPDHIRPGQRLQLS